eukprot:TRINITY_DN38041_c0_g1_i1.p1 TRINITY_DN38041_c0_g1~~TRINITY_DN38041_c0_g1_i1.p1  ORF type:complete len:496 (+),score=144.57 TRINITY_DN38041_c0_g1_i1:64-1551(+)
MSAADDEESEVKVDNVARLEILQLFKKFDLNGDGTLDCSDLGRVLAAADPKVWTKDRVSSLFETMRKDANSRIAFQEFLEWAWLPNERHQPFQAALEELKAGQGKKVVAPAVPKELPQPTLGRIQSDASELMTCDALMKKAADRSDNDYWDQDEDDLDASLENLEMLADAPPANKKAWAGLTCTRGATGVTALQLDLKTQAAANGKALEATLSGKDAVHGSELVWVRGELLGRGTMGSVYRALDQRTGEVIAVKEVNFDETKAAEKRYQEALENELDICGALRHPRIVSILGHDRIDGSLFVYMEYMAGGSLQQVLQDFGALDESCLIATYTREVVEGLEYLHGQKPSVLHRDIKSGNILVGLDCKVKLADFGCSKRTDDSMQKTMRGSIPWMAPEVVMNRGYGSKADIWSLGCVVIEMATAKLPWGGFDNPMLAMRKIGMSKLTPPVPDTLSTAAASFIEGCCQRDPKERCTAKEALTHDFLKAEHHDVEFFDA